MYLDISLKYNWPSFNMSNNLSTALCGYYHGGTTTFQNYDGRFWGSNRTDNNNMYSLYVDTSYIDNLGYWYRNDGLSIRCVLK